MKRLYIPLPEAVGRRALLHTLLSKNRNTVTGEQVEQVVERTAGFSGADVKNLCTEAAMGPMRSLGDMELLSVRENEIPVIAFEHFDTALKSVRPSVATGDLELYLKFNADFGEPNPGLHSRRPPPPPLVQF